MAWTITGARSRWGALARVERDYVITWLCIGILWSICEVFRDIGLPFKFLYIGTLVMWLLFGLYFQILPFLMKRITFNLPFALFYTNQEECKNKRNWIMSDLIGIGIIPMSNNLLLEGAQLWVKVIAMVVWLTLFFFGFLYNYRKFVEKEIEVPEKNGIEKTLKIVAVTFISFLIIIGFTIHNIWYK